jgi:hypothetical protein
MPKPIGKGITKDETLSNEPTVAELVLVVFAWKMPINRQIN